MFAKEVSSFACVQFQKLQTKHKKRQAKTEARPKTKASESFGARAAEALPIRSILFNQSDCDLEWSVKRKSGNKRKGREKGNVNAQVFCKRQRNRMQIKKKISSSFHLSIVCLNWLIVWLCLLLPLAERGWAWPLSNSRCVGFATVSW